MNVTRRLMQGLMWISLAVVVSQPVVAQSERVGVAAAVRGYVFKSAVPGKLGQRVRSGQPVFEGERITTGSTGRMQLLLTDQSVFTIGPRSSMVMDEYRFKPEDDDKGSVVANFVTGVFRFLTGKVAAKRPANMRMRANTVATIGIRGTSGIIEVKSSGPIETSEVQNGSAPVQDAFPFQPEGDLPAESVTTALTGAGPNDQGDDVGQVVIQSNLPNGPTPQTLANAQQALVFDAFGGFQVIDAAAFIARVATSLTIPPPALNAPGGDGDAAAGSDDSLLNAAADAVFPGGSRADSTVNSLTDALTVFDGLLRPADFNPPVTLSGTAQGNLIQSNGNGGSFSALFSMNTGTGVGNFSSIDFLPTGGTTVTGGLTQNFTIGQNSPILGGGLPVSGLSPSGANANVTAFFAKKFSSEGSTPVNHIFVAVDFEDTISNITAVGAGRGQLNPP